MGLISLLIQVARIFLCFLSWPSVTLVCPLYTSIRAIESDKKPCYEHCLKYWVLFAIITLLEWTFAEFLVWIAYWPHAKGLAYLLFALPRSGFAPFFYSRFVKPYITPDSCVHCIFLISEMINFAFSKQNDCPDAASVHIKDYEEEVWEIFTCEVESYYSLEQVSSLTKVRCNDECENFVTCKVISDPASDQLIKPRKIEKHTKGRQQKQEDELLKNARFSNARECREEVTMRSAIFKTANRENVQKEWSCAVCQVTASSEKNLREHMRGRKHRAKEEELNENETSLSLQDNIESQPETNTEEYYYYITSLLESLKTLNLRGVISKIERPIRFCKWKRPENGWIKLNTDGSVHRESSGLGGILRDHNGTAICGYVSKAPRDDIFMVELWAIWRGLRLALTLGVRLVWVESDSMSAVKTINREQPSYVVKASACIECIWRILERFDEYKVSHSWRESNRAADYLSKMDVKGSDIVLLPGSFPRCLEDMIRDDAKGKWYCRL